MFISFETRFRETHEHICLEKNHSTGNQQIVRNDCLILQKDVLTEQNITTVVEPL